MNKFLFFIMIIGVSFVSCKSAKQAKTKDARSSEIGIETPSNDPINADNRIAKNTHPGSGSLDPKHSKAYHIVAYAKQFKGVKYRFGGATKAGMDCSGLVFESFRAHDIMLPRISRDMAKNGEKISLNHVDIGDLVFFKTGSKRNDISHVGLVVSSDAGQIEFIHATTSAGVIVSSMTEPYWDKAFVEARRML